MFSINIPAGKFMLTLINCRIWTRCKMYSELKEKHTYRSSALSVIFKQIFYLVPLLSLLAFNNFMPSWVMSQEEELISANCCYTFLLLRSESHTYIREGLLFIKVAQLQYSRFHDNKDMNTEYFNVLLNITDTKSNRPKLCGNCALPQNFHTRKSEESTVFFAVLVTPLIRLFNISQKYF